MSEKKLSSEIISALEKATSSDIDEYNIVIHDNNTGGDGYVGEMIFVSLQNKTKNEKIHIVVKQSLKTNNSTAMEMVASSYFNEIHFYKEIWPTLDSFQKAFPSVTPFDKIPTCYGVRHESEKKIIVLENLKPDGFVMFKRDEAFNDIHMKLLLKLYGQFHGTSAAFREHNQDEFRKLTNVLKDSLECFFKLKAMKLYFYLFMSQTNLFVQDEKIKAKLNRYIEKSSEIAMDALKYDGRNPVILHGDCWSNNFLFKFDANGEPVDVRLLDFQLCRVGSVVTDLSYMIYSGSTKEIYDNLDFYLKIYYDSFSDTLRSYNLMPSEIFTFEDLQKEWKNHCSFGYVMSQILWRTKLSKAYETKNLAEVEETAEMKGNAESMIEELMNALQIDRSRAREIFVDLAHHMYENDYL